MATTTTNKVERWKVAPVDRSIEASSTSGVQRLVVAEVPDGVGESEAMANSTHVLAMVLHDEHVVVVGVFEQVALHSVPTREVPSPHVTAAGAGPELGVFVPVAVHSVPSSVVPVPQVIAGATQDVLPTEDAVPEGHATQLLFLPFSVAKVEDGHNLQAIAPTISLNSPGLHGKHEP